MVSELNRNGSAMRFRLQLITVGEDGSERMHSVAELERDSTLRLETTGLTLAEGKQILKHLQEVVVEEQVEACVVQHRHCAICSKPLSTKGHHQIKLQTVFGNLQIRSPRLRCCPCGEADRTKSFSPLARVSFRSVPRQRDSYLETLFASLLSYGATTKLLAELLPLDEATQCGNDSQSSVESGRAERSGNVFQARSICGLWRWIWRAQHSRSQEETTRKLLKAVEEFSTHPSTQSRLHSELRRALPQR